MKTRTTLSILGTTFCLACSSTKWVSCNDISVQTKSKIEQQINEYYSKTDLKPSEWKVVEVTCIGDSIIEARTKTKTETGELFEFSTDADFINTTHLLPKVY